MAFRELLSAGKCVREMPAQLNSDHQHRFPACTFTPLHGRRSVVLWSRHDCNARRAWFLSCVTSQNKEPRGLAEKVWPSIGALRLEGFLYGSKVICGAGGLHLLPPLKIFRLYLLDEKLLQWKQLAQDHGGFHLISVYLKKNKTHLPTHTFLLLPPLCTLFSIFIYCCQKCHNGAMVLLGVLEMLSTPGQTTTKETDTDTVCMQSCTKYKFVSKCKSFSAIICYQFHFSNEY